MAHLDKTGKWRVNSDCESVAAMQHRSWFVLPPALEAYYRPRHSDYRTLPPERPDCGSADPITPIGLIYPHGDGQIFIPQELDGRRGRAILKAVHRNPQATVHWHLDDQYMGSTTTLHEMAVAPAAGNHRLTLIDDRGNRVEKTVAVIDR
jgi:penicillin-binding protein 1C